MDLYHGAWRVSQSWDLILDSDEKVDVYYFEVGGPQQPPQETEFQTLHNSILVTNELGDTLMVEGLNPFFDNGQGALQPFKNPEWNVYSFMPYCGTSCIPFMYGCTDDTAQNYDDEANTEDGAVTTMLDARRLDTSSTTIRDTKRTMTTAAARRSLCLGAWTPKPLTTIQKQT